MKKISRWGKDHKRSARIIIVTSFVLLTGLGILAGTLLNTLDISIPEAVLFLFIAVAAAGFIFYPSRSFKEQKSRSVYYLRQKSCDLLLAGSTFLLVVCVANQPGHLFRWVQPLQATTAGGTSLPKDSTVKTYKSIAAFAASMKDDNGKPLKLKERKKLLKEQVRAIQHAKEPSKGVKVLLIILSVIVAAALIIGVASLACSISCSGSEALAIVVGVLGTALVIWLLIAVIRSITGKKKKVKDPEKEAAPVN